MYIYMYNYSCVSALMYAVEWLNLQRKKVSVYESLMSCMNMSFVQGSFAKKISQPIDEFMFSTHCCYPICVATRPQPHWGSNHVWKTTTGVHVYVCVWERVNHLPTHTHAHTHAPTNTHTYIPPTTPHPHPHPHTLTRTYTHTYIHTHIHTVIISKKFVFWTTVEVCKWSEVKMK